MDKQEARITCSGCGTSYKVKIPVTDKPVSFTCRKCGKVLKLKVKTVPAEKKADELDQGLAPGFETTQLPDTEDYQSPSPATKPAPEPAAFVEAPLAGPPAEKGEPADDQPRKWLVLLEDLIKGPFSKNEIVQMIKSGEVETGTSLRMGERPWVKAIEVGEFKEYFHEGGKPAKDSALATISLLDKEDAGEAGVPELSPASFGAMLTSALTYPVADGKPIPLVIFAAIALVASTAISFDFLIGLPVNLIVWILLYGYLAELMRHSIRSPGDPPPDWNFKNIKELVTYGVNVFLVLLVYSMIPVSICLLVMIFAFLNNMLTLGYVFIGVSVVVFLVSLYVVPAALVLLVTSTRVGLALNPGKAIAVCNKGGQPYLVLFGVTIVLGLVRGIASVGAVFLTEVTEVGFVFSGLLLALVVSYAYFVWFRALGRFAAEYGGVAKKVTGAQ